MKNKICHQKPHLETAHTAIWFLKADFPCSFVPTIYWTADILNCAYYLLNHNLLNCWYTKLWRRLSDDLSSVRNWSGLWSQPFVHARGKLTWHVHQSTLTALAASLLVQMQQQAQAPKPVFQLLCCYLHYPCCKLTGSASTTCTSSWPVFQVLSCYFQYLKEYSRWHSSTVHIV